MNYVDSMGLRAPTPSRADLARIRRRAADLFNPVDKSAQDRAIYENINVIKPIVVPFHGNSVVRSINKTLVKKSVLSAVRPKLGDILWTFSPLTYGLEDAYSTVIYHSVDLLHSLPGVPSDALLEAESSLVKKSDYVLASSIGVATHLREMGADPQIWENVADVKKFTECASPTRDRTVVFAGNLTPTKVDFDVLGKIADRGISVTLAGPVSIDGAGGGVELERLLRHKNVKYVGNLSLLDLAHLCGKSMVGLIPYEMNSYTAGVFPLKVYEYLAAGMEVVATPIASLSAAAPHGVRIAGRNNFADEVAKALDSWSVEEARKRTAAASNHSWENRIEQAWKLVEGVQSPIAR
ncbi:glycosyltransferase [Rhodococcus ruber]|uniref:glycosyltransferase n=1 Tax=Rhodococcus ruber TaxID=1830 RepID=UPI00131F028A|nr:glycosyltransferase [Rhodococcus ruber]